MQLKIDESFAEKVIPENDSVRLLDKMVEEMDIGALMRAYDAHGRKPATPPRTMLKKYCTPAWSISIRQGKSRAVVSGISITSKYMNIPTVWHVIFRRALDILFEFIPVIAIFVIPFIEIPA